MIIELLLLVLAITQIVQCLQNKESIGQNRKFANRSYEMNYQHQKVYVENCNNNKARAEIIEAQIQLENDAIELRVRTDALLELQKEVIQGQEALEEAKKEFEDLVTTIHTSIKKYAPKAVAAPKKKKTKIVAKVSRKPVSKKVSKKKIAA